MELYATGFNAHTQLLPTPSPYPTPSPPPPSDLLTFQKIASGTSSIRVLCALWSTTVFEIDHQLFLNGFHDTSIYHNEPITGLSARDVKAVFGDAGGGVIGALGWRGELWKVVEREGGLGFLECEVERGSWLGLEREEGEGAGERRGVIDWIAVAENGQVGVVVICLLPLLSFDSFILLMSLFFSSSLLTLSFQNLQIRTPHPQTHPHLLHSHNPPPLNQTQQPSCIPSPPSPPS